VIALAPALAAIWSVPWFVTQDGPAHIYNAQIIACSFDPHSPFESFYTVRWQPIPNWTGHLALAAMMAVLPAWVADRIMTSTTLLGFAAATFWLRLRVYGEHSAGAALWCALLATNICWLLGFHSFMLGSCMFATTLGFWWPGRDHFSARQALAIALLLILGYFCHLVSLTLTVLCLLVLAVRNPSQPCSASRWRPRLKRLASITVACVPVIFLGLFYRRLSRCAGPLQPAWIGLSKPWALPQWLDRVGAIDPLALASQEGRAFSDLIGLPLALCPPFIWLILAVLLWWYGRMTARTTQRAFDPASRLSGSARLPDSPLADASGDRAGWLLAACILILGGIACPDSLGVAHGQVLPQRVLLLSLAALVPVFDLNNARWWGRAATAALVAAIALRATIIWGFAFESNRTAGQVVCARTTVGERQRVVVLLASSRSRFRASPLLHADNWLGVDTGNVVWGNYETAHYYFPVHFRPELTRPQPGELEAMSLSEAPEKAGARLRDWELILANHAGSIDVVLIWGDDPCLEAVTARFFDVKEERGALHIYRKRGRPGGRSP
jgi:hypothetical protein